MNRKLAGQDGYIVVISTILMTIMLATGLSTIAFVDTGTDRTEDQRKRESALTLAEGALYAQGFSLARNWPGPNALLLNETCASGRTCTYVYDTACTSNIDYGASAYALKPHRLQCPTRDNLSRYQSSDAARAAFDSNDFRNGGVWTTWIRDNGGDLAASYNPAQANAAQPGCRVTPCSYDANGDETLWVQARAVIKNRSRNIVAQLRLEQLRESAPGAAVVAGAVSITNNGNKEIIAAGDSNVIVRCTPDYAERNPTCTDANPGQVAPWPPITRNPAAPNALGREQVRRFRDRAIIDGTYFPAGSCPDEIPRAEVVFVESCFTDAPPSSGIPESNQAVKPGATATTAQCPSGNLPSDLHKPCLNTQDTPGVVIWHCGNADFAGSNWTFIGLLYFVNGSDEDPEFPCAAKLGTTPPTCSGQQLTHHDALRTGAGFGIWGAIAVDGNGCVKLGANGGQIVFNRNAFGALKSYGAVGLVQNSWRELNPNESLGGAGV